MYADRARVVSCAARFCFCRFFATSSMLSPTCATCGLSSRKTFARFLRSFSPLKIFTRSGAPTPLLPHRIGLSPPSPPPPAAPPPTLPPPAPPAAAFAVSSLIFRPPALAAWIIDTTSLASASNSSAIFTSCCGFIPSGTVAPPIIAAAAPTCIGLSLTVTVGNPLSERTLFAMFAIELRKVRS